MSDGIFDNAIIFQGCRKVQSVMPRYLDRRRESVEIGERHKLPEFLTRDNTESRKCVAAFFI